MNVIKIGMDAVIKVDILKVDTKIALYVDRKGEGGKRR